MGAERDTVILFLSDNGASSEQLIRGDGHDRTAPPGSARTFLGLGPGWATCSNTPFRLHKSWVNEGGIASPMIVHWPKVIAVLEKLPQDLVLSVECGTVEQAERSIKHLKPLLR